MDNHIKDIDKEIQDAQALKFTYARLLEGADQLLLALKEQKQGLEKEKEARAVLEEHAPIAFPLAGSEQPAKKPQQMGKLNTQLYEEVILANGRPMHMTSILEESLNRGLVLQGARPAMVQIRGALAGCKRLYNVGGNTWWVIDKPIPEDSPNTNGHEQTLGIPTLSLTPPSNFVVPHSAISDKENSY